jgi:xylulokinase
MSVPPAPRAFSLLPKGRSWRATSSHGVDSPQPGWFEQHADTVWWKGLLAVLPQLLNGRAGTDIAAVAVSGIGPCLLPADASGAALRPAILYGIDTRAQPQIERLTAELGADEIRRSAGSALTSQAIGPKLAWLREQEPAVYARTAMMLSCSSFLVHRLTGQYVLDHHSASQCAPMYDLVGQRWRTDWCDLIAPGLPMPPLRWPGEVAGTVTELTGLPRGTPVTAGTIDAWAEAVSVGVR